MATTLDADGIRTMLLGLFLGMVLYALGLVARVALPDPVNITVWFALTLAGLIVVTGWFYATRFRGFRLRWLGKADKAGKRAEGRRVREKRKPKRY